LSLEIRSENSCLKCSILHRWQWTNCLHKWNRSTPGTTLVYTASIPN
jgi:hypothetical protein